MHAISISSSSQFIFINIKVEKLSLSFWLSFLPIPTTRISSEDKLQQMNAEQATGVTRH